MPTLRIFSPIYGPGFPERYGTLALPSLMQAGNVPALIAAGWDVRVSVYTDISSYADVAEYGYEQSSELAGALRDAFPGAKIVEREG